MATLFVVVLALLPTPFVPRRRVSPPLAISSVSRKPKFSVSENNRKLALEKERIRQEEDRRAARAAEEAREAERVAERAALSSLVGDDGLINRKRDAVQILRRMGRAGLLPDERATAIVLDALVASGARSSPQHRLVQQVAALCRVYPPETLGPEQAAAFMRSAAALRQCRAVLEWWPAVRGQFEDCDDHALRALLRLGRWEEAHALLGTANQAGTLRHAQLRWVAAACVRAAQGGAARRALRLALEVGLADGGLVRDALRASAAAAAAAPNATAAAQEGEEAVAALHAAEDAGCISAASAPGVCRAAAEVYIQLGQHGPALLELRTLRAPRPQGAAPGARPTRLALCRRQLEALLLLLARDGEWLRARWLVRAALHEGLWLTSTAARVALGACACDDGTERQLFGTRRRALAVQAEAAEATALAAEAAAGGEGEGVVVMRRPAAAATAAVAAAAASTAGGEGACVEVLERRWARRVLTARLQALLPPNAPETAPRAAVVRAAAALAEEEAAAAAAAVSGKQASASATSKAATAVAAEAAAKAVPIWQLRQVLRAAAAQQGMQGMPELACTLFARLAEAEAREGGAASSTASGAASGGELVGDGAQDAPGFGEWCERELCELILPCLEARGDWRSALALPHGTPSAASFAAALTHECDTARWAAIAEARAGSRVERRRAALRRWLHAAEDPARWKERRGRAGRKATDAERAAARAAAAGGVASRLAYEQLGAEALARASALRTRAVAAQVPLGGKALSALIGAHAALRRDQEAAALAAEACAARVPLSAEAYLAALSSVRSTAELKDVVEAMNGSPRFPWLRAYTDAATSSWLALRGALSPSGGRRVAALQAASAREVRAGLQATSMLGTSLGGVSALLGDLQASGVAVESGSRAQLLSSALLEGRLQQQLVISLWLPLMSPYGDALLAALGPAFAFRFAPTPRGSEFGGAWCFDWRPDDTHPALRKWLRHRATLDSRFAEGATGAGLCPVDGGVFVLEGMLLALQLGADLEAARSGSRGRGSLPSTEAAATRPAPPARAQLVQQLQQLRLALQGLIVRYETAAAADARRQRRGGKAGFQRLPEAAAGPGAPALGALGAVPRALLGAVDLQQGLRSTAHLQSAKVFVFALDQLLPQLTQPAPLPPQTAADPAAASSRLRPGKPARLTKREQRAFSDITRGGLLERDAVDPSPQRTTVVTAAIVALLT